MRTVRAVVFDLDDTLYSERSYVLSGFRAVALWAEEQWGIPQHQGFNELRCLFGEGSRGNTFNSWLEGHKIPPLDWIPKMVQVYREHWPQITPRPEAPQLLLRLRRRYSLGLVTDGYLQVQRRKLASLGIGSCFDSIVFSDELGSECWKPSPQPFIEVLRKLAISGEDAVYVADNPTKDFLGAQKVAMWTVRVRYPDGLYSYLEPVSDEYAPHEEISDLLSLETLFARM
jgi:putative hydrolase of the HAD superfamily